MKILSVCLNPTFQYTLCIPRLDIGEVNRATGHYLDVAGKGMNTARIATQLGAEAMWLSHLGGSRIDEMLALCKADGVEVLWADAKSEMRSCITILSEGATTELVQEPHPVDPSVEGPIRELFAQHYKEYDAMIIAGTRAPGYSKDIYTDFVRMAKEAGLFVLLDIKGEDLKACLPYGVDVIKPNLSEAAHTFLSLEVGETEDTSDLRRHMEPFMEEIWHKHKTASVFTRGKFDIWAYGPSFFTIPVQEVEAINTIGSGDSFNAALTVSLLKGASLKQAVSDAAEVATRNARTLRPGTIIDSGERCLP
ncbi:MAG: carbohydrate kinase [Spirochaetales bacterium]|nr:carbohydrate kinase [Spirochaetales bacterium]